MFRDICPVISNPAALRFIIEEFGRRFPVETLDMVGGVEARGLAFAAFLAEYYNKGFFMVRKHGKLPGPTLKQAYELEYGEAVMEIQADALQPGQRILIVADLLATGGTAEAAAKLIEQAQSEVVGLAFVIELTELKGRSRLKDYRVETLVDY